MLDCVFSLRVSLRAFVISYVLRSLSCKTVAMSATWVCCVIAYRVVMGCLMFLWLAKQEMSSDVLKLSCQCIEQPIIVSVGL